MDIDSNTTDTLEKINLTPAASEEIKRLMSEEAEKELYLRVGVVSGGCSGLSYTMGFDDKKHDFDSEFVFDDVRVIVDETALLHISGSTLDFQGGLMGGGFTFHNPNAARSCGCGSSFTC